MIGHSRFRALALVVALGVPLGDSPCARAAEIDARRLAELARPDLGKLEETPRKQLREARERLDALLAGPTPGPEGLGEEFGLMGRLYYVYDYLDLAKVCFLNAGDLQPSDYRWPHYLGITYRLEGQLELAAESFKRCLGLRPDYVAAWIRRGDALVELSRLEEAESCYRRALELIPESAAAHFGLGRILYLRGGYEAAITHLERSLELQSTATSVHHLLGMAYRQSGDIEAAREHVGQNRGGRVRVDDPLIDDLGNLVQSSQVHFNAGVEAMRRSDYETAIKWFLLAREEKPEDYLVPYNLALAMLRLGAREEAKQWLRTSIEINPEFRNGHFNLAILLAEEERFEEASAHFGEAHRIDPEDEVAHLEWATALSRSGRPEQAVEELGRLLELHPSNTEALLNLGMLQVQLQRPQEGMQTFEELLSIGGDPQVQAEANLRLGVLLDEASRPSEALARYRAAVELSPGSPDAHASLGAALGRAGRLAEAAEQYSLTIEIDPTRINAHFSRAMALILGDSYVEALAALEESVAAHGDAMPLAHALARLLVTCPDATVRDGARGLRLATEVFQKAQTLDHAETVAMALAETGRFEEAIRWQQRVVSEAELGGDQQWLRIARQRLEQYRRGEPCRAPWKAG